MPGSLKLILPDLQHKQALIEFREEFIRSGEYMHGAGGLADMTDYESWLYTLSLNSENFTAPPGQVPSTTYLAVRESGGQIVGMTNIRHRLDTHLLQEGGHIGYCVRPSQRRRGYGRAILTLALKECRRRGILRVLVTCADDNKGSARIIQASGGRLQNIVSSSWGPMRRYWINLSERES